MSYLNVSHFMSTNKHAREYPYLYEGITDQEILIIEDQNESLLRNIKEQEDRLVLLRKQVQQKIKLYNANKELESLLSCRRGWGCICKRNH